MRSKEQHKKYNLQYYHNKRKKLIQELGVHCVICGSTENLEFDHIDSDTKSFGISAQVQHSSDYLKDELKKCQLLCHTCHIQKSKYSKDINVKIDKNIANTICKEYASSTLTQKELGKKYGVSARTVSSIINGERWGDETIVTRQLLLNVDKTTNYAIQKVAVDKIDPISGEVIQTYTSISEATNDGYKSGAISRCCNGKLKHHRGFVWSKHV